MNGRPRRRAVAAAQYASPRARRRRALLILAAALAAVGLAIAAGRIAGTAAAPEQPVVAAGVRRVHAASAVLSVPGRWSPVAFKTAGVADLDAASTAVLAPSPGLSARVVVTLLPADDASLLPEPLRAAVAGELPPPRRARVAGREAWLYSDLVSTAQRQMEVTVVPTSAGVLAVACIAPVFAWSAAVGCAQEIEAIRMPGASFFAPARSLIVRLRLPAIVATLDRARVDGRRALRAARRPAGQARAAAALRRAYAVATAAVRRLGSSDAEALVAALRSTGAAYERLGAAASHAWPQRYRQARRDVALRDARLAAALKAASD
jgi:hypothetical protein